MRRKRPLRRERVEASQNLPAYEIRENAQARRVIVRVTKECEVVVVVPRGFDFSCAPKMVATRRQWLEGALERMRERRDERGADDVPARLHLQAIDELWTMEYVPGRRAGSSAVRLTTNAGNRVMISGAATGSRVDPRKVREVLEKWLKQKARETFVPWLRELSDEFGLSFERVQIRAQRSRWASCSSRGTMSLNYRLLFLPRALARYVLVHELAHLREMNHSARFWQVVATMEPDWKRLDRELSQSSAAIPALLA